MYCLMKTTIDLPDDLLHRAKVAAAQRKTTLKELVVQGLDYAIRHESPGTEELKKAQARKLLLALQAANTCPMRPLSREEIYDR